MSKGVKRSKSNKMQKNRKVSKKVNQRNKKTKKVGKMRGGVRSAYAYFKSNKKLPEPGDNNNNNENYGDMFNPSEKEKQRTEKRSADLNSLQENANRFSNVETNQGPGRGPKQRGRLPSNLFNNPNKEPTNHSRGATRVSGPRTHGRHFRKSYSSNTNIEV